MTRAAAPLPDLPDRTDPLDLPDGWLRALRDPDGPDGGAGAVVAYGGAGLTGAAGSLTPVELALLRGVRGGPRGDHPVVTLVPTAGGDDDETMDRFRELVSAAGGEPHVLALFRRTEAPFSDVLDRTDLVYVSGGAVANLAALWRLHGLDEALLAARARGVPVSGSSAGALIWSVGGVTTSTGVPSEWDDGLGVVPVSLCPHADTQPDRVALYERLVAAGELPPGWALDEAAALVLTGGRPAVLLSDTPGATAHPVG